MDRCAAEAGHLVVFDRTPDRPWADKIFRRPASAAGVPITVWGCSEAAPLSLRGAPHQLRYRVGIDQGHGAMRTGWCGDHSGSSRSTP